MKPSKKFTVVIPNERYVFGKYIAVFILLLNAGALALNAANNQKNSIAGIIMISIAIAGIFIKPMRKVFPNPVSAGYFWAIFAWIMTGQYWIAAIVTALWWLNFLIKRNFEFAFSSEHIIVKTTPARTIKWFELNNALIKDGLLTIDFKNDKIIQGAILVEESDIEDEAEFNSFCKEQLAANGFAPAV